MWYGLLVDFSPAKFRFRPKADLRDSTASMFLCFRDIPRTEIRLHDFDQTQCLMHHKHCCSVKGRLGGTNLISYYLIDPDTAC